MPPQPTDFVLETPRLLLRRLNMNDLDALAVLYANKEVRRYFPDGTDGTLTYAETKEELEWIIERHYGGYGFGTWATIHKETGAFIGRCGLIPWHLQDEPDRLQVEVAYLLDKAYWRQGLGTEAARAIRDYAFDPLGLQRLICLVHPKNVASQKVAANTGFVFEKEYTDKFGLCYLYQLMRPASP
jgi:[ribosomal protein S5]-alanine N-acetyltransferase